VHEMTNLMQPNKSSDPNASKIPLTLLFRKGIHHEVSHQIAIALHHSSLSPTLSTFSKDRKPECENYDLRKALESVAGKDLFKHP
jgi:hypothetical protein